MASKLQIWNRAAIAAGETQLIQSESDTLQSAVLLSLLYDDLLREVLSLHPWTWAKAQAALTEVSELTTEHTGDGSTTEFTTPHDNSDASQLTVEVDGVESVLGTGWTYTAPTTGFDAIVTFAAAPALAAEIEITVTAARTGWDFVYALPDNCVKPLALLGEGERQELLLDPRSRTPFTIMPNNSMTGMLLCTNENEFETLEYTAIVRNAAIYPPHFVEALVRRLAAPLIEAIKKKTDEAQLMLQAYRMAVADAIMVDNANAGQREVLESPGLTSRF